VVGDSQTVFIKTGKGAPLTKKKNKLRTHGYGGGNRPWVIHGKTFHITNLWRRHEGQGRGSSGKNGKMGSSEMGGGRNIIHGKHNTRKKLREHDGCKEKR